MGILPAAHPWQGNAPLLAGLRTGYCGSLTTFSAWQLQCVLLLVGGRGRQGGQWDQVQPFSAPCSTRSAALRPCAAALHVARWAGRWLLGRAVHCCRIPVRHTCSSSTEGAWPCHARGNLLCFLTPLLHLPPGIAYMPCLQHLGP